jgi:VWFA-related protein
VSKFVCGNQVPRTRYNRPSLFAAIKKTVVITCILATGSVSQDTPSFQSKVEIVLVPCTIVDASGAPVNDLTRDEFRVFDNDVRRPLESVTMDSDLPLTLGIVIDSSDSQQEQVSEHRSTAAELLRRILRPGDRAFLLSVGESVRLWDDLRVASTDVANHDIANQWNETPGVPFGEPCPKRGNVPGLGPTSICGSSPLWNAIFDAGQKLRPINGNKALIFLTDGFDSGSTHTWNQAADAMNRADTTLYAIQYRSGFGSHLSLDLFKLVRETGGTRFNAPNGDYRQIVSRIESDLRHRYVLGFRPEKLSGKRMHEIRIETTRSNLVVRARKSYLEDPR